MKNVVAGVLVGLVFIACSSGSKPFDPGSLGSGGAGSTGSGGSGSIPTLPLFTRSDCGTIAVSALVPSTNQATPSAFAPGEVVGGRVAPDSVTNNEHHWALQLARGFYHLVLDAQTADGNWGNIGVKVTRRLANGDEETLFSGNEIARHYRDQAFFEVKAAALVTLKVTSVFGMVDYQMGVFANGAPVPSPLFDKCPTVKPVALGESASFTFGTTNGTASEEQWFLVNLPLGNYKFFLDATQAAGVSGNIIYDVDVLDQFGQESRVEGVISSNDISLHATAQGTLAVGEMGSYWVRLRNGNKDLNATMTITAE